MHVEQRVLMPRLFSPWARIDLFLAEHLQQSGIVLQLLVWFVDSDFWILGNTRQIKETMERHPQLLAYGTSSEQMVPGYDFVGLLDDRPSVYEKSCWLVDGIALLGSDWSELQFLSFGDEHNQWNTSAQMVDTMNFPGQKEFCVGVRYKLTLMNQRTGFQMVQQRMFGRSLVALKCVSWSIMCD